jgi:Flp pilus assembly protein TadD
MATVSDTLGWILYRSGNTADASQYLQLAVAAAPDDPDILYHLAVVTHALGDKTKARSYLQKALGLSETFHEAEAARKLYQSLSP